MVSRRGFLCSAATIVTGCLQRTGSDGDVPGTDEDSADMGGDTGGAKGDRGSDGVPSGRFRMTVDNGSRLLFDDSHVDPESVEIVDGRTFSVRFSLTDEGVERFRSGVNASELDSETPVTLVYRNETVFRAPIDPVLLRRVRTGEWSGGGLSVRGMNRSRTEELRDYLSG